MKTYQFILLLLFGMTAAGAGLFFPELVAMVRPAPPQNEEEQANTATPPEIDPDAEGPFVDFGTVVVNLNEQKLNYYLTLDLVLRFDMQSKSGTSAFSRELEYYKNLIESKRPLLKSWLIQHLAAKTADEIRGGAGVNRLRREIEDEFNRQLFADGQYRIAEALFSEYYVEAPR